MNLKNRDEVDKLQFLYSLLIFRISIMLHNRVFKLYCNSSFLLTNLPFQCMFYLAEAHHEFRIILDKIPIIFQ